MSLNFIAHLDALEHRQTLNDKKCAYGLLVSLTFYFLFYQNTFSLRETGMLCD